jgi:isoaspartyl peptidase/L-asparaginase-like protein (Ntn-hydrolase superfamily)
MKSPELEVPYEIVRLMGEGCSPQQACDQAVYAFHEKLTQRYGLST